MATSIFQVKTYNYYFWSSREPNYLPRVNLNLNGTDGEYCGITFVNDDDPLPEATNSGKNYFLYYRESQLDMLIDMLRNEKPIFVDFNNDNGWANSRITTTDEPVGEEEGKMLRRR